MEPTPRTAMLSNNGGHWHLYVGLAGTTVDLWPEHDWKRAAPAPTLTERQQVLAALGYGALPDAEWKWSEYSLSDDDPTSPVVLNGTLRIQQTMDGER